MLPPTTILEGEDNLVPEGTSHRYRADLVDEDGVAIQVAAITAITGWLKVHATNAVVNGRNAVNLLNVNGGSLVDVGGGVLRFFWQFDPADAVVVGSDQLERHRITVRFAYTKTSGGPGQLTKRTLYDVQALEDL